MSSLRLPLLAVLLALSSLALRAETQPDAAWLEKAKAAYPLATCVVSEEKLGEMGKPVDFVYEQAGYEPRLVRFCCKSCKKDFLKDPAKYLKLLDEAAATKPATPAGK